MEVEQTTTIEMSETAVAASPAELAEPKPAIRQRRYDVDWLRTLAMALLIFYHVTVAFQPWGEMIGFPVTDETFNCRLGQFRYFRPPPPWM